MDLWLSRRRIGTIPDDLSPLVMAISQVRGQTARLTGEGALSVLGPLQGYRFVMMLPGGLETGLPWEQSLLQVIEHTADLLEATGAAVLVTADDGLAGRYGAHALVALGVGKYADATVRGIRAVANGGIWSRSRRLGEAVLQQVSLRTGLPARGAPVWGGLPANIRPLFHRVTAPAIYFECGCISFPADEALLEHAEFQWRCACGIAEGVLRFFGETSATLWELAQLRMKQAVEEPQEPVEEAVMAPAEAPVEAPPEDSVETPAEVPVEAPPEIVAEAPQPEASPAPPVTVPAPTKAFKPSVQRPQPLTPYRRTREQPDGASPDEEGPEPMIQTPDGCWISRRAYALLQQQKAQSPDPVVPVLDDQGHVVWPELPPGFKR